MRVKGEGRDGEEEEEEERGVRMGESLLRMNAVSWAAPLLLPHTGNLHKVIDKRCRGVMRWKWRELVALVISTVETRNTSFRN